MKDKQHTMMAKRKSKTRPSRSTRRVKMNREMRLSEAEAQIDAESHTSYMFGPDDAWQIYKDNGFTDGEIRQIMLGKGWSRNKTPTRNIKGKTFMQIGMATNRSQADALARMQREKMGRNARVIPKKGGYGVWVSPAVRKYNSTTTRKPTTLLERAYAEEKRQARKVKPEDRKWFNFGRRRKKPKITQMSIKEELEQQELDSFYAFKDELTRKGVPEDEAFTKARRAAELQRKEREAQIELAKQNKEIEKALRIAREREEIAEYKQGLSDYRQGVPLSTVAKYNSLEIATTTTGTVVGATVAGLTAAAAWPLIPISAIVGFFSAKAIRNNVGGIGLKQGVNNTLDAVDRGTTGISESIRVSKDTGQPNIRTLGLLREPKREKPEKPFRLKEIERKEKRAKKRAKRDEKRRIRREVRRSKKASP